MVAAALGLHFNAGKCSSLIISKGMANPAASLHIRGVVVRSLDEGEHEDYLGVPIGTCPHSAQLLPPPGKLTLVAESDLPPVKS